MPSKGRMIGAVCQNCGRVFQARLADVKKGWGRYCSRSCSSSGEHNPRYIGGQLPNYQYNLRQKKKNPARFIAMGKVYRAVKSGKLVRLPCEVCGMAKSEAHHVDYSRPLDVKWLCRTHHIQEHMRIKAELESLKGQT